MIRLRWRDVTGCSASCPACACRYRETAARILPCRRQIRRRCPVPPSPLPAGREVHPRLHRYPVSSGCQHYARRKIDGELSGRVRIGRSGECSARNRCSRESARIRIERHVERICRPGSVKVLAACNDSLNRPGLAGRNHEVFCRTVVECIAGCLKVL